MWDPEDGKVLELDSLPHDVIIAIMQPKNLFVRVKRKLIPIGACNWKIKGKKNQRTSNKSMRKEKRSVYFRNHPVDLLFAMTYYG